MRRETFARGVRAVRRYLPPSAACAVESGGPHVLLPALSLSPYPNSALSAWQLAIIAVIPVLALAAWLILVFAADRQPRHRRVAGTASLPRLPRAEESEHEQPGRKAA